MPVEVRACNSNSQGYVTEPTMFFNHLDRHPTAWEGSGVKSSSLAMLFTTASSHNVDLGMMFNDYACGKSIMTGEQFCDFAKNCQLFATEADVDDFFMMCAGTNYRPTLRISADRFVAALVRVFEKMASSRHIQQAHACNTLVRDHITPHAVQRYAHLQEPHSHAASYGYGGPLAMRPRHGEVTHSRTSAPTTPYARTHGGMRNDPTNADWNKKGQKLQQSQIPGFGGSRSGDGKYYEQ